MLVMLGGTEKTTTGLTECGESQLMGSVRA